MNVKKRDVITYFVLISIILFLLYVPTSLTYIDSNLVYDAGEKSTLGETYVKFVQMHWVNKINSGKDILSGDRDRTEKDINRAEKYFLHLLETIPADQKRHILSKQKEEIFLTLIKINKLRNDSKKTIKFYEDLLEFEPLNIYYQIDFAKYLIDQNMSDKALNQIEKVLELDQTNTYAMEEKIKLLNTSGKKDLAIDAYRSYMESEFSYYGTMEFFYANKQAPFSATSRAVKKVIIDNELHTYSFKINPDDVVQNITRIRIDPLMQISCFHGGEGLVCYVDSIIIRDIDNNLVLNLSNIVASSSHNVKILGNNTFQIIGEDPYFTIDLPPAIIISDGVMVDVNMKYFF